MPEFSLILSTKDRTAELARLVASLEGQSYSDYELIVMDQNDDDRLIPILAASRHQEKFRHIRCSPGLSAARNVALTHVTGRIIAFPDDDCWYPSDTLKSVSEWFAANRTYDLLTLNSLDENGVRSCNRWFQDSCDINLLNVYRTSVGYSIFIRGDGLARAVRYDEGIGPGAKTPYVGGEDSDFVLMALAKGARGRFEAKWHIGHPLKDIRDASVSRERAYVYGLGMGFVQRKHRLVWLWAALAAFDFGRSMCAFVVGRREPAALWYRHGRGLVDGFFELGSSPRAYHSN